LTNNVSIIYSLTRSNRPFLNFPLKCNDECRYIYVINIDSKAMRRINCPFGKDYVMPIPDQVLTDIISNKCKLVFDYSRENFDCVHSNNLDLTGHFIKNTVEFYKLAKDQVILLTGNMIPYKEVPYNVCSLNRAFYTLVPLASNNFVETQNKLIFSKHRRQYKILCLMNVPRMHRIKFAYDIFSNNLRQDNLITCKASNIHYNLNFFNSTSSNFNSKEFVDSLPWVYDHPVTEKHPKKLLDSQKEENLYTDSYVNFVIETYFDHTSTYNKNYELDFSEKVSKPISRMQPFVVLGQEGILQYLHNEGYKTFDRWWDESYDTEVDGNVRYDKVWQIFKYINSLSTYQLSEMLLEMQPILEHNRLLFEENVKSKKYLQEFNDTLIKLFDK